MITPAIQPAPSTLPPTQTAKLWQAAHDFEAMAIGQLLQPMFETIDVKHSAFGGGEAEEAWRPMLVDAIGKQMAARGGIGLAVPLEGARIVRERRLERDLAPCELNLVEREAGRGLGEALGRLVGLRARELLEGEQEQLLRIARRTLAEALVHEEAVRVGVGAVELLLHHRDFLRQEQVRAAGVLHAPRGEEAAQPVPDLCLGERAVGERTGEDRIACRGNFAGRNEERPRFGKGIGVVAREALLEGIAGDLDIVAAHLGIFGAELLPARARAQDAEPLAAQAFRKRRVGIAGEEVLDLARVAALEVSRQEPVRRIGGQHVAGELVAVFLQGAPLAARGGVASGQE